MGHIEDWFSVNSVNPLVELLSKVRDNKKSLETLRSLLDGFSIRRNIDGAH